MKRIRRNLGNINSSVGGFGVIELAGVEGLRDLDFPGSRHPRVTESRGLHVTRTPGMMEGRTRVMAPLPLAITPEYRSLFTGGKIKN